MNSDVEKLFAILDEMKSGYLAICLLSNFENHMGNLSKKDLDKAISIINGKSNDNLALMFQLDSYRFNFPHLLHEDKNIFVNALNHPYYADHDKTIKISLPEMPDERTMRETFESEKI